MRIFTSKMEAETKGTKYINKLDEVKNKQTS